MLAIILNFSENPLSVACPDCGVSDLPRIPAEFCQQSRALNKTTPKKEKQKSEKQLIWLESIWQQSPCPALNSMASSGWSASHEWQLLFILIRSLQEGEEWGDRACASTWHKVFSSSTGGCFVVVLCPFWLSCVLAQKISLAWRDRFPGTGMDGHLCSLCV